MDDDEFDEVDFDWDESGGPWPSVGSGPLHWTHVPIVVFAFVDECGGLISSTAGRIARLLQAHANHAAGRKQVAQEMQADIESITGDRS